MDFLGHHFTTAGVSPLPEKIMAIKKFPNPSTVKALQKFVGMVNHYYRCLPGIASIMTPLYTTLSNKPKELTWGSPQADTFQQTKEALATETLLAFPAPGKPLLTMDPSNIAIGAVLEQVIHGQPRSLFFFSCKLHNDERNYSTFDQELLAVHQAVHHFCHFLEGIAVTIQTDHLPLVHAFTKQTDAWSFHQSRHLSAISEFNCTLRHLLGKKNLVAGMGRHML